MGALDVVEADQVRSLDYQARRAEFIARAPEEVVRSVLTRIRLLLERAPSTGLALRPALGAHLGARGGLLGL
jgi:hypothetical protein